MMTSSWMEVLSPTPASWLLDERKGVVIWSQMENKLFEKALAHFDKDTGDRWENVADMIPTKTIEDVISHYRDLVEDVSQIEAGLVPFPGYSSSFTLGWEGDGLNRSYGGAKRPGARSSDHERKKGVPWTEEEHRLFLLGLKKYGKGDWRNISRNYVVSRTPTQVASHAQKYFIRLNSGSKDKRRSSIHDITTVNLPDGRSLTASPPSALSVQSRPSPAHPLTGDWFSGSVDSNRDSESNGYGNPFMQPPSYGMDPYGMKSRAQYLHSGALHDPIVEHYGMLF